MYTLQWVFVDALGVGRAAFFKAIGFTFDHSVMINLRIHLEAMGRAPGRHAMIAATRLLATAIVSLSISIQSAAADDLLVRAESLLEQENAHAAYELLLPVQEQRAGHPDYDFLLARAASAVKRADVALFALERVVTVEPGYAGAHLAMAQAYLVLGERQAALAALAMARQTGDVPATKIAAIQSAARAEALDPASTTQFNAYLEMVLGYDDNVTSTTSQNLIPTPTGTFLLSDDVLDQDDAFGKIRGGLRLFHTLTSEFDLSLRTNAFGRFNKDVDDQDLAAVDAQLGLRWRRARTSVTGAFYGQKFNRDYDGYRNSYGPLVQVRHRLDSNNDVSGFFRATRLNYVSDDSRDAIRYVAGATYMHLFSGQYSPMAYVHAFGGKNDPEDSAGDDHGYYLAGARIGGRLTLNPELRAYASAGYSRKRFTSDHRRFLTNREDERFRLRAGLRYTPAKRWTVRPEVSYTDNESNIVLNDYERTMLSLTIRRDFN